MALAHRPTSPALRMGSGSSSLGTPTAGRAANWHPTSSSSPRSSRTREAGSKWAQSERRLGSPCNRSRASPVAHAARLRALSLLRLCAPREHLRMRAALHAAPTAPPISPWKPRSTDMALDPNGRLMQMFGSAAQSIPQVKQTRARCSASCVQMCPTSLGPLRAARPCYLTRTRARARTRARSLVALVWRASCGSGVGQGSACACRLRVRHRCSS
jgi:hypothetical protein